MTSADFKARIVGGNIHCQITSKCNLGAPVFCFSLMGPGSVVSGGTMTRSVGGYAEVQLPDLAAGKPHEVVLRYADDEHRPTNRAWLPLGGYLKSGSELINLPRLKSGVDLRAVPPPAKPDGLGLIPEPVSWIPGKGVLAVEAFRTDAKIWASVASLANRCNLPEFLSDRGTFVASSKDTNLRQDEYKIEIGPTGISLSYGGRTGAHYAGITLLVLRAVHSGQLPCGTISDRPRFDWRGQHLDCARHFYEVTSVLGLLDLMALLKMNRFHWHFSDDEAFRLQLDSVPELAQMTAQRGEGHLVPGVFGGGMLAGGSYSKADAISVIEHAGSLFIEVLPEIEFPAHAMALSRAFPKTRDPDDRGQEVSVQGYTENALNPAMPATWEIVEAITNEVGKLFPFGIVHLGADEMPPGTWDGSPAVDRLKAEEDLESSDDVFGWALGKLAGKLAENGLRCAAWEEASRGKNGGIGHNAILFSWTGQEAGIDAARSGYDIVMLPAQHVYLDMAHTSDPQDWGAAWAAFVSLTDTINWTVIPDPEIADRVIGVEGAFWSEFTTRDAEMQPMIAPRILGVATKAWCTNQNIDPAQFTTNARVFCDILTCMGWAWNPTCFAS